MKNYLKIAVILLAIFVLFFGVQYVYISLKTPTPEVEKPINVVTYSCNEGKSINASYYQGQSQPMPAPGEPPVPTGSVTLLLSEGRSLSLHQTISADGTRYANPDESFVFWSKGAGALVLENNQEKNYIGCVVSTSTPA